MNQNTFKKMFFLKKPTNIGDIDSSSLINLCYEHKLFFDLTDKSLYIWIPSIKVTELTALIIFNHLRLFYLKVSNFQDLEFKFSFSFMIEFVFLDEIAGFSAVPNKLRFDYKTLYDGRVFLIEPDSTKEGGIFKDVLSFILSSLRRRGRGLRDTRLSSFPKIRLSIRLSDQRVDPLLDGDLGALKSLDNDLLLDYIFTKRSLDILSDNVFFKHVLILES